MKSNNKQIKDCTLLLSTYDGGEDLWEGFFTSLKYQWPELDMPIVVNTETKIAKFPGYEIRTINVPKKNMAWGKRLKLVLKQIETDYILLFLEDYWLDDRVDNEYFEGSLQWLRDNPDISTFSYYPCLPGENIDDGQFDRMELRPQKCEYKFNCQVAIWRKDMLIKYIRNHEDPWEWEVYASRRASRFHERFYTLKEDAKKCFSYGDPSIGCLIHKGKWVPGVAEEMCNKYNLKIDFSIRGFEDFEAYNNPPKQSLMDRLKRPHRIKRIWNKIKLVLHKFMSLI